MLVNNRLRSCQMSMQILRFDIILIKKIIKNKNRRASLYLTGFLIIYSLFALLTSFFLKDYFPILIRNPYILFYLSCIHKLLTIISTILCTSIMKILSLFSTINQKIVKSFNTLVNVVPFVGVVGVFYGRIVEKRIIFFNEYLFAIEILFIGYLTIIMVEKYLESQKNSILNPEYYNNKLFYYLRTITPETWSKTCDSLLDTIEAFPNEITRWEKRNLKYVAYIVVAWDLLGFFRYFLKTLISNAIATRRVSS